METAHAADLVNEVAGLFYVMTWGETPPKHCRKTDLMMSRTFLKPVEL